MHNFRYLFFLLLLVLFGTQNASAQRRGALEVVSPNGRLQVRVALEGRITYSVAFDGKDVIVDSPISMTLEGGRVLGENPRLRRREARSVDETIETDLFYRSNVRDHFNELRLEMRDDYAVVFRAYDDGIAYRFETNLGGRIKVVSEQATFRFTGDHTMFVVPVEGFHHSYENDFVKEPISAFAARNVNGQLPLAVKPADGPTVVITEADLYDYPGLYLIGGGEPNALGSTHPPFPLAEEPGGHMAFANLVTQAADYIADTDGTRTFPWRVIAVSDGDAGLMDTDLVYKLSRPPAEGMDFSWVQPGKVAWDWWHAWMIPGVDFKSGINTETYKYYIDFAARNGLQYINLDEGWSDQFDLTKVNPDVDLEEIVRYADSKGIGVFLWAVARTVEAQMDVAMAQFERWGVKGLKIDFMDRDDQRMVNFYWRTAEEAARRGILINYHGAYKPAGLSRTFPNVINREAVRGLEYNKFNRVGTTPTYAVTIPFTRLLAGEMDYTPGAMHNGQPDVYRMVNNQPMSQGTRTQQLALYVVLYGPLQMLADVPNRYEAEPVILNYLSRVPTVWDETVPLAGEIGEFAAIARRKGDTWYVAAINGETARTVEVDLSFLEPGPYVAETFRDGVNADRIGEDYVHEFRTIAAPGKITFDMARGGGGVYVLRPLK